jgi:hypothetical protein
MTFSVAMGLTHGTRFELRSQRLQNFLALLHAVFRAVRAPTEF